VAAVFFAAPVVSSAGSLEALKSGSTARFHYLTPQAVKTADAEVQAVSGYEQDADSAVAAGSEQDRLYYLAQDQVELPGFPAPPEAGSAEDKADMAAVLQWQKDRTSAQCEAALAQAETSYDSFFAAVSPFPSPLPSSVYGFFKRAASDSEAAYRLLKKIHKRPRPAQQNNEVKPCLGKTGGYSYPSGHSAISHIMGLILSDLVPRESAKFMIYADQAALNRVIGGVHFPSDIEAGKRLGDVMYKKFLQNPVFVSDMESAKKYLHQTN